MTHINELEDKIKECIDKELDIKNNKILIDGLSKMGKGALLELRNIIDDVLRRS